MREVPEFCSPGGTRHVAVMDPEGSAPVGAAIRACPTRERVVVIVMQTAQGRTKAITLSRRAFGA